ncbi:hypothetical protein [Alteromonas sp. 14N.309.X.WAT.G.H12]|uniref:hypothetical protein n=1 Tax=Alteromonas sp. 14N.309.X.WAT.G.H12 TaxID=3120824 RepID=UPI002FD50774
MTDLATFLYQVASALRAKRTARLLDNVQPIRIMPLAIVENMKHDLHRRLHILNYTPEYRKHYGETKAFNPLHEALIAAADAIELAADRLNLDKPIPKSKRHFRYIKSEDGFMRLFSLLNHKKEAFLQLMSAMESPSSKYYQSNWSGFEVKLAIEELIRYVEGIHVIQYEQVDLPTYEQFVTFIFDFANEKKLQNMYPYDLLYSAKLEAKKGVTRWVTSSDSISIYATDHAEKYGVTPHNPTFFTPNTCFKKAG